MNSTGRLSISVCFLILSFFVCFACPASEAQESKKLKEVKIQGNVRVEEDGIRLYIKARPGDAFDSGVVDQDVKAVYRMGFFDDVKAELSPDGVLTYTVREKPYIREVKIQGNEQVSKEKIESALGVGPRTILDRVKIAEGVQKVRKLYQEQGYVNAQVEFAVSLVENNQAIVQVEISEGRRLLIERIAFEGTSAFSDSELRGLMSTKERWFLSFITNRGVLDHDVLTNDVAILSSHYYDHGYINHKIDEPVILRGRDGIEVVIRVEEGEPYRVGKVEIGGDLIEDAGNLLKKVKLTTGQIFRGSRLREDIATLTELYSDKGFAFAQVEPVTNVHAEEKNIDVALVINRGPPVYFNRVVIAGNTKTRDKVVRREMAAAEQELFSGKKIKESRNALQRTGYFEDVQLTTKKTDQADGVDLLVDVKEGPTGTFSIGGGYSSGDQFIFTTSIAEKNLFGRGQGINASFDLGTTRQDFILSFTEPYFYDTPLSLGLDAFNAAREFNDFDQRRTGFGVRTGYPLKRLGLPFLRRLDGDATYERPKYVYDPLIEHTRGGLAYELTRESINNINDAAPASIRDEKGTSWTSSLTPILSYDSRDHYFNPTEGTLSDLSLKFAGLGGDNRFLKTDARARWYYSFLKDPQWGGTYTVALGGTLGYGVGFQERANGKKDLPLFERYFPGGINSVRGFADRSLGPKEGNDVVGGDKQAVLNAELLFPILEQYGLRGVAFFDMGQAFAESESFNLGDFRRSVGAGARWLSPFGPLRVEFGFPLNKKSGDDTSVVGFSLGGQP
ncbi:MAG: outer membrane protein assembly factor BamA [Deltaproteobacteria bacterium RIFCSPLOWO2_12_FULL_57_22]|nr:MAG: outer membrane protein assembly factor BamA [Deltaproteobacteria bacterium RIFCSPLOWO2_12_FULL_57_22]